MGRVDYKSEWAVLGAALDAFNALETKMEDVICAYLHPTPDRMNFVRDNLLHNSVVSFGGKVRVVLAISKASGGKRLSRDKFHRALAIRNAMAHGDFRRHIRENRDPAVRPIGEFLVVRSHKGDGTFEERPKAVATAELMQLLVDLREDLAALHDRLAT